MVSWLYRRQTLTLVLPVLENSRSIGVDKLVQMDALEPAKRLSPFGMVGQNGVCL